MKSLRVVVGKDAAAMMPREKLEDMLSREVLTPKKIEKALSRQVDFEALRDEL
jgi:hypothetical protein